MKKYFWLVLIATIATHNLLGQGNDGIRSTNVLPPEAYTFKFSSAGSVDYHGDYSASIPLMTVPGRGGMDYPISANYQSGITTDQRATWAGLGWNVNPGSVTRVVNGMPDNALYVQANGMHQNGASTDYPPTSGTTGYSYPNPDYLDYYLVNIPGVVSGLVVPVNGNGDSIPDYTFQEFNGFQITMDMTAQGNSFIFGTSFNRLFIPAPSTSTTTEYKDIGFIWVRGPDGTLYVFGLPLRSEIVWYDPAPQFNARFIVEYVSSWQLTAIISHDATFAYNGGNLDPTENSGSWVKFEYNYPYNGVNKTVRNIRPLHYDRSNQSTKDPYGLLTQTTYLSKIITPTHEAVFETSARNDISFLSPYNSTYSTLTGIIGDYTDSPNGTTGVFIKPLRLDRIILKQRYPYASNISWVQFNYAPLGQELCRFYPSFNVSTGSGSMNVQNIGKTTLNEIMIADSFTGYWYRFKYTDQIDNFNPYFIADQSQHTTLGTTIQANEVYSGSNYTYDAGYYRSRSGRMGYLFARSSELTTYSPSIRNTKAAAAWSLRTLEYPTGVVDTISYELDQFDFVADSVACSNPVVTINGGDTIITYLNAPLWINLAEDEIGIRVNYISSFDSLTQEARKIRYNYSVGHLPGLPLNYLRQKSSYLGADIVRACMFGYSSSHVEYNAITITNPDSTRLRTSYSYVNSGDFYDLQKIMPTCILTIDRSAPRGKVIRTEHFDAQGQLTLRQSNNYAFAKKYSGYPPSDPLLAMNPDNWWYYTAGRRLLESYANIKYNDTTSTYENDIVLGASSRKALVNFTNYMYNDRLQVISAVVKDEPWWLHTEYKYVHASTLPYAGAFVNKNRINEMASIYVYQKSFQNVVVPRTYTEYAYKLFGGSYRVDSIRTWTDNNRDSIITSDEVTTQKTVLSYDGYGNPLAILDANRVQADFEWSDVYKNSKLTKSTLYSGGMALSKTYTYNQLHLLQSLTDENNITSSYQYDNLGRLKKILGPGGITMKEYFYNFKNQVNNPPVPWGPEE